jgi:hypothetical protein
MRKARAMRSFLLVYEMESIVVKYRERRERDVFLLIYRSGTLLG